MISETQRTIAIFLCKSKLWKLDYFMYLLWVRPRWGTKWIFDWMRKTQKVDDKHHAPSCGANHYHRTRLVHDYCTCGAK
jgi:hypothetical protein